MNIIFSLMNKAQLKIALYERQRLYARMLKDNVTGAAKVQVEKEIETILVKLYKQVKPTKL